MIRNCIPALFLDPSEFWDGNLTLHDRFDRGELAPVFLCYPLGAHGYQIVRTRASSSSLALLLRILLKQNTALLSYVC